MEVKDMCDALNRALDLEIEGYWFYLKCAEHTKNIDGKVLFKHLAGEEKLHYNRVERIYEENFDTEYCGYKRSIKEPSGVFEEKVPGGNLDKKSDALDALNIAVRAEENSIELYGRLAEGSADHGMRVLFEKLVDEEREHHSILEAEVEFVTETGEFCDFKTVTM